MSAGATPNHCITDLGVPRGPESGTAAEPCCGRCASKTWVAAVSLLPARDYLQLLIGGGHGPCGVARECRGHPKSLCALRTGVSHCSGTGC
ncbi:hypothetical protein NDU88_004223 [Pleurodeles waltl]|uniref:Uncharacterized protein n=1 Tax=Pleurodeles waltl TaxID=8319 RepID=A0AAV7WR82_PLEWA|nr:hypothetical protein NDU88_004223 [Pleurodeles waltl]